MEKVWTHEQDQDKMYFQVIWEGSIEWHKHFRKHQNAFECYFLKT